MAVAKPCWALALKKRRPRATRLKTEIICDMLTELICGSMTPLYPQALRRGAGEPGLLGRDILSLPGALSFLFGGETPEPETVRGLLLDEIARLKREGVDEELFHAVQNQLYGELVQDLENIGGRGRRAGIVVFQGAERPPTRSRRWPPLRFRT